MKDIKIIIDGKEIAATIDDVVRQQLTQPVQKTGYERVEKDENYWYIGTTTNVYRGLEQFTESDTELYDNANYYSDQTVAENNARADKLMRQLRRFAVEHREKELDWTSSIANLHAKWEIVFTPNKKILATSMSNMTKVFGRIYFDEYYTALRAIDTFKDELLWYFTEYQDSL